MTPKSINRDYDCPADISALAHSAAAAGCSEWSILVLRQDKKLENFFIDALNLNLIKWRVLLE